MGALMTPKRIAVVAGVMLLASCGSSKSSANNATTAAPATTSAATTAAPATTAQPATTAAAPDTTGETASTGASTTGTAAATVAVADTKLGKVLVDGKGRTLYVFTKDSAGTSACTGGCATAWPPLMATGAVVPGAGLDAEDFATIMRSDGSKQVTFYGHPLYTFGGDKAAGDINGQKVAGSWFVVGTDGNPVTT